MNKGGPAFPVQFTNHSDSNLMLTDGEVVPPMGTQVYTGMSLRDYFAAKVMPSMLALKINESADHDEVMSELAKGAYNWADAMIKARGKP